jgi:hypothetical protein
VDVKKKTTKMSKDYGEFVRTFEFPVDQVVLLPIVQPGATIPIPTETVRSRGVRYVERKTEQGWQVEEGVYEVTLRLDPGADAIIGIRVNGRLPETHDSPHLEYTKVLATGGTFEVTWLIRARECDNFITVVNEGASLFTLSRLSNSPPGVRALIGQMRILRVR